MHGEDNECHQSAVGRGTRCHAHGPNVGAPPSGSPAAAAPAAASANSVVALRWAKNAHPSDWDTMRAVCETVEYGRPQMESSSTHGPFISSRSCSHEYGLASDAIRRAMESACARAFGLGMSVQRSAESS